MIAAHYDCAIAATLLRAWRSALIEHNAKVTLFILIADPVNQHKQFTIFSLEKSHWFYTISEVMSYISVISFLCCRTDSL